MRKIAILSVAALALAGTTAVVAQGQVAPERQPRAERPDRPAPPTTRAEAQQRAAQMFARMDANGDGKLDQADREAGQKAMFDRIDANKDGAISPAEFSAHHAPGAMGGEASGHEEHGDQDGNAPMAGRHGRGGPDMMKGPMMGHMMEGADANKDGALTQAEFTAAALARFDKADTNKDGTISTAERRAARPDHTMRGEGRPRQDH